MNNKLINLIIKAGVILFLVKYIIGKKNINQNDFMKILPIIMIGWCLMSKIQLNENLEEEIPKNEETEVATAVEANALNEEQNANIDTQTALENAQLAANTAKNEAATVENNNVSVHAASKAAIAANDTVNALADVQNAVESNNTDEALVAVDAAQNAAIEAESAQNEVAQITPSSETELAHAAATNVVNETAKMKDALIKKSNAEKVVMDATNAKNNAIESAQVESIPININDMDPMASEQAAPHKDNKLKQLTPANIANDLQITNANNTEVNTLQETVDQINSATNGQCKLGQQIDSTTGKCVAITVQTDDNNAVAVDVVPTNPSLNMAVTDVSDGKLTAQETVDLIEADAKKKEIKCTEMGMIVDKDTGECIGLTDKTGEYVNVKRSPQVKNKEVTYRVNCTDNDMSKCKWEKVGKLTPKRSMAQHGYSFVRPHEWDIPRKRTPVCNPQKDCQVCPLYINKTTEDLLTVQNIHENIPEYKVTA